MNEELGRFDEGLAVSSLADEAAERVRAAYQNQGYFTVQVEGRAAKAERNSMPYDILIQVDNIGKQYRLADLNIINAIQFPNQQLRDLFPIQRGEIFSREKIAKGLEDLRSLYGSQGYIGMTAVPNTDFDKDNAIATLTIDVDEGRQFRVRSIGVLGVDHEAGARILTEMELQPGSIYTSGAWERSIRMFPNIAPNDPVVEQKKVDAEKGWVDIVLDLRKHAPCPLDMSVSTAVGLHQPR